MSQGLRKYTWRTSQNLHKCWHGPLARHKKPPILWSQFALSWIKWHFLDSGAAICFILSCFKILTIFSRKLFFWLMKILSMSIVSPLQPSSLYFHSPTVTAPLCGLSTSNVDSGGVSMGLSRSSGDCPSPRDHTESVRRDTHTRTHAYTHHTKLIITIALT